MELIVLSMLTTYMLIKSFTNLLTLQKVTFTNRRQALYIDHHFVTSLTDLGYNSRHNSRLIQNMIESEVPLSDKSHFTITLIVFVCRR